MSTESTKAAPGGAYRYYVRAMLVAVYTFNFLDRQILGIPVALLADRFSRSWIMTITFALWSGFTALCGTATSFTSLFLMRVGVGIGEAGGTYYFGFMSDRLAPLFGSESLRWSIYTGMGFYLLSATLFVLASRHLEKDWQD